MTDSDRPHLDQLLADLPEVEPSATLKRTVAEIPLRHPRTANWKLYWPFGGLWKSALTASLAAALGIYLGLVSIEEPTPDTTWDEVAALAFASGLDEELAP